MKTVTIYSGSKDHKPPTDALSIGVMHIANPYSVPGLRLLTGQNSQVRAYVLQDKKAMIVLNVAKKEALNGRDIFFYCVGGKHRSVALAEALANNMNNRTEVYAKVKHLAL